MTARRLAIAITILLVATLCAFGFQEAGSRNSTSTVPIEVTTLMKDYMEAYSQGTEYSVEYVYFEDAFKRDAYIASGDRLFSYSVEYIEKINEDLYAFTVVVKTEQSTLYSANGYERVYNFIARINNEWWYINGVSNIPLNLRDGLEEDKYKYNDDNIVEADDIIDVIDVK